MEAYSESLELFRSISPTSVSVSVTLTHIATAKEANKDYNSAEGDYREALQIAKISDRQDGIAAITGNLAGLAFAREQWAEAESLAREALALAEKVGQQELIASDCHLLAKALFKQNPVDAVGATRPVQKSALSGNVEAQENDLSDREGSSLHEALLLSRRAVEIYTRLRHPVLQSAQEMLAEIERALQKSER
ncbi:MAG TPA: tetratricopeptide repeat protein [Anaerolineales bacterium]|nr:tetratricopeptide repeat protein [Anaerolineales bacterium]